MRIYLPSMCDRQAVDIENFLDHDREITIIDGDFGRASDKLDKHIHLFLIKTFDKAPKPFDDWRFN
jgi:hypothetical protein